MKLVHAVSLLLLLAAFLAALDPEEPEELRVELLRVTPDRWVYHSADTMDLTLLAWASRDTVGTLEARGVAGRINVERQVNLTAGVNELHVEHTLPKCNVCGGISPGNYTVTSKLSSGNLTVNGTVEIEIRQ